ncbi:MAG: OmpA family protein [Proteobacteria bacterium]|nr:MAG: OmpA family protein [Pseudomonadota bacterium]
MKKKDIPRIHLAIAGIFCIIPNSIFAANNDIKVPFSLQNYELSSEDGFKEFIETYKLDEKIGFEISDHSVGLKTSSLAYITEKNRTLKVYQTILKSGVKPSRVAISSSKTNAGSVSVSAKEGVQSAIATLPSLNAENVEENSFKIFFDSASANPKFSSREELTNFLASFGKGNHDAVILEGHTDSVGNVNYNKALADLRALSVFKLLVDNGLPPYRIDTTAVAQSSAPGKGKASAEDRMVIVKWTENKAIAAEAAKVEKPVEEVKGPEIEAIPAPAPAAIVQPKENTEVHSETKRKTGLLDLVVTAGSLIPGGELSEHAKSAASWGLGIGKSFWTNENQEVRGTIFYHGNSDLKAKESTLDGPLHVSSYTARIDYVFGGDNFRPFVGLGAGAFKWDGSIVQKSSSIRNTGAKSDGAGLAALGLDIYLTDYLILATEATFYNIGGHFSDKLYGAELSLRWRLK